MLSISLNQTVVMVTLQEAWLTTVEEYFTGWVERPHSVDNFHTLLEELCNWKAATSYSLCPFAVHFHSIR